MRREEISLPLSRGHLARNPSAPREPRVLLSPSSSSGDERRAGGGHPDPHPARQGRSAAADEPPEGKFCYDFTLPRCPLAPPPRLPRGRWVFPGRNSRHPERGVRGVRGERRLDRAGRAGPQAASLLVGGGAPASALPPRLSAPPQRR